MTVEFIEFIIFTEVIDLWLTFVYYLTFYNNMEQKEISVICKCL